MRTYSEEQPLEHLAVVVGVRGRVEPVCIVLVIMLGKIQEDGRGLKDSKVSAAVVNKSGDATIRVQFNEPRFLLDIG